MGTKRFDSLIDCWRHGTGACVACRRCGHYRAISGLVEWIYITKHLRRRPADFAQAAKIFKCTRCGAKDAVITPGDTPRIWRGNR